eukprot:GHVQ01031760.1.p1 GENE.GHVQ01031760.1~~GHVQ01031760.1.p1  ORF type:complete len:147 (-),score=7.18 GHVQ01031760.1:4-444(-)
MNNLLGLQGLSQRRIALTLTAITRWHHERNLPPPPLTHPHVCDLIKAIRNAAFFTIQLWGMTRFSRESREGIPLAKITTRLKHQLVAPCPTQPPSSHSLRKSAARLLTDNGISPDIIHEIGRWKSDAHFVYTSPSDSKRLDVIADI